MTDGRSGGQAVGRSGGRAVGRSGGQAVGRGRGIAALLALILFLTASPPDRLTALSAQSLSRRLDARLDAAPFNRLLWGVALVDQDGKLLYGRNADRLFILTDVDGLYDRNPEADKDAKLIPVVDEITKDIELIAGSRKNERSTGGMRTKINAAKIAMQSGCNMVISNGREKDVIARVALGEDIGTLFTATSRYTNRERWILFACPRGKITVDAGAEKALREGRSLLPCGIVSVEGRFKKGEVVRINGFAKGLANCSSSEMNALVQKCQRDKAAERYRQVV
jgi:predicted ribosome-associated RNA-binding protein Tma20